jgi:uncharacterized protein YueI
MVMHRDMAAPKGLIITAGKAVQRQDPHVEAKLKSLKQSDSGTY